MALTRKQKRAGLILCCLAVLGASVGLVLYSLSDSIMFFYTPSEVLERHVAAEQLFRLGGLVNDGSLKSLGGSTVQFVVTDKDKALNVSYTGVLPDLFREGQGVVAEGALGADGTFLADTVLAKHDETYMPREVADALKKRGRWKEGELKSQ